MTTARKISTYCLFSWLAFVTQYLPCYAQPELDPGKWVKELADKDPKKNEAAKRLSEVLYHTDSAKIFQFLDEVAQKGKSKGYHFHARFNVIKAGVIYTKNAYYELYQERKSVNRDSIRQQLVKLYSSAIDMAYRSEDDFLIAYASYSYASVIVMFGEVGLSVMYAKNGIDLYEKLSHPVLPQEYQFLAELLFKVREYDQCIYYAKKAVIAWQKSPNEFRPFTVSCMNTVALGYHRQKMYDSAFIFYNKALQLAKQINNPVWVGIVSGNMGQILYMQGKYDSAYAWLKMDYQTSKDSGFYDNAANSLQWAARANLARGNKAEALSEVREAFQLLGVWPDASYLRNAYYTTTQVFREMGNYDSAFYYNNLYAAINDSLEKVVATSSLAISKARLNDEMSRYNIQTLNKEKKSQLLLRNILVAGLIVLFLIALLIVNRQRLKEKIKTEKSEQEKLRMEQEIASAKEQMKMFTDNIIEKTSLIEKLEAQAKDKAASSEQQIIISELSQQTILTEEDWLKFKTLFEKIYPGFFIKLKQKFHDITVAEQRMAALIRLNLTMRQMASMLGISTDSVRKTRQRLRQRLQLSADASLEDNVASI
ncbi:MAG TPA: tetratricopeptide repeat protein [Chitinophagaceae bacterium]|nr:tetratricopeptide repeat protein [Chitinophagaceae bacterium]